MRWACSLTPARATAKFKAFNDDNYRLFLSGCHEVPAGQRDRRAEDQVHEAPPDPDGQLRAGRGRGQAPRRDLPRDGQPGAPGETEQQWNIDGFNALLRFTLC